VTPYSCQLGKSRVLTVKLRSFLIAGALPILAGAFAASYYLSSPSIPADLIVPPADRNSGLTVRFFGASTLSFDDGSTTIMIDAFFSRPEPLQVFFAKIEPDEKRIADALKRGDVRNLAAIFVAHSHYDHAMDAGVVAQKTGATVYGSYSTANIMRGAGLPAQRTPIIRDGDTYGLGQFRVTVFRTPHSHDARYPGTIDKPLKPPAKVSDYKLGSAYSFLIEHGERKILVIPSANFIRSKFSSVPADIVFLGIGGLGKQGKAFVSAYWHEVVEIPKARLVIPIHWDNFMRPLGKRLRPMPRALDNFDNSMRMLRPLAEHTGITLRLLEAFTPMALD
jgi:L-ascorbate metabolism protein UlaG (beta-lactamase superfamily)